MISLFFRQKARRFARTCARHSPASLVLPHVADGRNSVGMTTAERNEGHHEIKLQSETEVKRCSCEQP
jgi:hypothetical protein